MISSLQPQAYLLCAFIFFSGCASAPPVLKVAPTIACAFADVLVDQTDIPRFEEAFGTETGIGSRACRAIKSLLTGDDSGSSEPATIEKSTQFDVQVSTGEFIRVTLEPPSQ